ncbi:MULTISPECIES: TetR/AcrR family transcriptional regulator [Roseobacteraceae]|jgi:AcrR family transcriptional regulator|uniref:TetR family transcriptional regulator n=1 Tax=Celeribacter baekdonensis B30 TaxID=1208323 RepID=K2JIC5_9RHOB|nr:MULTISPECIES: TetR/AcrR family transcriptional regulator [Roseobacteraceae]EKE74172.1 TetR family transcriptional regulator [Celeribacter baekdonensis B30]KAB6716820.1 TetR/AcrR family transcriptional regulator [Roseobacter sp. TSBP12]|tara:strand:+ start:8633 stop:9256 length:624 start_codon:yes stop_codon:yes gene_type:complete
MSDTHPAIKKGRKFDQVVEGARIVFLRDGFEGASVDDIAREAGVSKATLYSYFPDKRVLFLEIAAQETRRQADAFEERMDENLSPDALLPNVGRKILDFILSDFGQAVFRIAVSESDRFPELGRKYYESGPALVTKRLSQYLASCTARGELAIDDIELAAEQFAELCKVRVQSMRLFQACCDIDDSEKQKVIDGAVHMFLCCYGVRK